MVKKKPEKDYRKIAAASMYRPAAKKRMPRILVYSRNKKGKTHFAVSAGVDRTLILDPEEGADEMKRSNPHVWPMNRWEDWDNAYEFLRHVNECPFPDCPQPGHPFTWVSPDGLTRAANHALKYVRKLEEERSLTRIPGMTVRQDYYKTSELMKDLLTKFHNLPQGIIFTAQERMIEASDSEEDEDYDENVAQYVPDLPKGARGSVNSIVDVIGRIYVVRIETDDGKTRNQRRLWVGDSARYDTGYRSDFVLPDYIEDPTVGKLVRLMRTGSVKTTQKGKK